MGAVFSSKMISLRLRTEIMTSLLYEKWCSPQGCHPTTEIIHLPIVGSMNCALIRGEISCRFPQALIKKEMSYLVGGQWADSWPGADWTMAGASDCFWPGAGWTRKRDQAEKVSGGVFSKVPPFSLHHYDWYAQIFSACKTRCLTANIISCLHEFSNIII